MPLPFILGGIAAAAAVAGVGSGIKGGMKMKDANDTMESAKRMQRRAINKFEENNKKTTKQMDSVGKTELSILSSFEEFADLMENIQGRPEFEKYSKEDIKLPEYTAEELREVSVGAGVLMGGLGGAAAGTAGGFAAAGATTSAVIEWSSSYQCSIGSIRRRCAWYFCLCWRNGFRVCCLRWSYSGSWSFSWWNDF